MAQTSKKQITHNLWKFLSTSEALERLEDPQTADPDSQEFQLFMSQVRDIHPLAGKVMTHKDIKYCKCQLVSEILTKVHLVNTENWILKWKCNQPEEVQICMGCPCALNFFETNSHVQRQVCPILPVPIITINQPPVLAPLDYTEANPESLHLLRAP
ncbi:hypothetical protein JAAARDRAFT_198546 [Jaapia argillacea MUCL 33604]|uniref:Uncharacterized protein n=1 Tax=Jaapia argillacea MUCL 33604 TaxID=933084 RepID=A0A067PE70_9AGAM|nr:hypothetical protein JAAARDRAFT_198546 [Jaapia argillacea MUCL 33604]